MSEIFVSYARSTAAQAGRIAEALRSLGYGVWRDDELPAHRSYGEVIAERLEAARAVVVVWSADAVKSQWVQSEADKARSDGKLVQLTIDGAKPPMPFDRIQCADLSDWKGDVAAPGWRKVAASVSELAGGARGASPADPPVRKLSICVLPFANMSDDPQQEYFSDGVSEDIITDLSKVSTLFVVARNTAFQFKAKAIDVPTLARQLGVSHVLEGSVRKAGGRVRITAQLIDGATGGHLWAERWDRDLTDIFALQDEISEAVVRALKLKLLPQEKEAIERRGTTSADAYNLYLMARQRYIEGNRGDMRGLEIISRLCRRATEIDPSYARAWALMALAQTYVHFYEGKGEDDGMAAAEQALALDPNFAEAHAVKAKHLYERGRPDEAFVELELAVRADPDSREVNETAGDLNLREGRLEDAIRHYEKAASDGMAEDYGSPGMLLTCYRAVHDDEGVRRSARMSLERAERALARDQSNGSAMGFGGSALAALGETERTREWIERALLIDPDNMNMRYNFACALASNLGDPAGALELLEPFFAVVSATYLNHAKADPDLHSLRGEPRFQILLAAAEARLASVSDPSV
ncbi:MAG: TIR domain-containing protein [Caulobacteraceae bacterium]